jgi:hypothetical protein
VKQNEPAALAQLYGGANGWPGTPFPIRESSRGQPSLTFAFGQSLSHCMPATLKTRKPVNELTVEDLLAFPIWEFAADEEGAEGQDETWVRPVRHSQVPREAYS